MARKQKKLTRKERAQQQQAAISRRRTEKGWVSPQERTKQQNELIEDMQPLVSMIDYEAMKPAEFTEKFMTIVMDSIELAEEPEFTEIFADPNQTMFTYLKVAEELGYGDPALLDQLPEGQREETKYEMLETTTQRVLNDELRQEVVKALDKLRLRLKKSGQRAEAAKAAAVQSVLNDRKMRDLWSGVGLIQGIIWRSLGAGFELTGLSMELEEAEGSGGQTEISEAFYEKMAQAIDRIPGLQSFLAKQVDRVWEEGSDAIFEGELYLGLFTPEEIEAGLEIYETSHEDDEAPAPETPSPEDASKKGPGLISRLDAYLTDHFTPERLEQLRTRLATLVKEAEFPPEWRPFILMVQESMADDEALEHEKGFFLQALIGEMRYATESFEEEETDDE